MSQQLIQIDGIVWLYDGYNDVEALCPKHRLPLDVDQYSTIVSCRDCGKKWEIPRYYQEEVRYVLDKIKSKSLKDFKVLNLDDEAIPLAEEKLKDNKYFVTGLLTKSKVGLRLVLYAGEKRKENKTQIFVEPEIRRVAFDQKDLHPTDIFLKIEGTFADNTKASFQRKDQD